MRITKVDIVKTFVWIFVCAFVAIVTSSLVGCSSTPVIQTRHVALQIDDRIYDSCPRPTEVLEDYGVGVKAQLADKSEAEIDALTLRAYGKTKQDHLACYKTLINVKDAYEKLKLSVGK